MGNRAQLGRSPQSRPRGSPLVEGEGAMGRYRRAETVLFETLGGSLSGCCRAAPVRAGDRAGRLLPAAGAALVYGS